MDTVFHTCLGAEPWPPAPTASILDGLWWCEGVGGLEDGEFALVRASGQAEALYAAIADYERQTGDRQREDDWTVRPATAEEVIAWWRRVQFPSVDDPDCDDGDCDDGHAACRNCGRPAWDRAHVDEDGNPSPPCCFWREAWARTDCDGDKDCNEVALRPAMPPGEED